MTLEQLKEFVARNVPSRYVYISSNPYTAKGVAVYNLYYNSHLSSSKLNSSTVENQRIFSSFLMTSSFPSQLSFSPPMLLDTYTKPLKPNSIVNFIDLSGQFLAK
jgi:hypothetical protein